MPYTQKVLWLLWMALRVLLSDGFWRSLGKKPNVILYACVALKRLGEGNLVGKLVWVSLNQSPCALVGTWGYFLLFYVFFPPVLGLKLRASCLLGRCFTTVTTTAQDKYSFSFFFFFFVVPGTELRAYTLSHSTSPFMCWLF
jgi:hypothetical protein